MNEIFVKLISTIENLLILPGTWLFPFKWSTVIPGSSAVRFTFGHPSKDLGPGIHFATTGQTMQVKHTNKASIASESMYVLTGDGVSLRVDGVVIYRITSLAKYLTMTEDSDSFMSDICDSAIRDAVSDVSFEDITKNSDDLQDKIKIKMSEICKDIGVSIKKYRFQNIELTDPFVRGFSSIKSMGPNLTEAAKQMANSLSISQRDAAMVLSHNIQFVADILSYKSEEMEEQETEDESE